MLLDIGPHGSGQGVADGDGGLNEHFISILSQAYNEGTGQVTQAGCDELGLIQYGCHLLQAFIAHLPVLVIELINQARGDFLTET